MLTGWVFHCFLFVFKFILIILIIWGIFIIYLFIYLLFLLGWGPSHGVQGLPVYLRAPPRGVPWALLYNYKMLYNNG